MKNYALFSFFIVSFFVFNLTINAQTTVYTWEDYGLQFEIPNTHEIKVSTADEFESGDSQTWLNLYPYKDIEATADGMVYDIVSDGYYDIESEGEYSSGGWEGYWVRCTSEEYPDWKYWIIGFIDPESENNFYAIIWWKKDDNEAYNIAYDMSYSFTKM